VALGVSVFLASRIRYLPVILAFAVNKAIKSFGKIGLQKAV